MRSPLSCAFLVLFSSGLVSGCGHYRPPLPSVDEALAVSADAEADLPVAAAYLVTARGPVARSGVLEGGGGGAPYVLALTAFVLEWPDGRLLLVDAGSDAASSRELGDVIDAAGYSRGPFVHERDVADVLAARAADVGGVLLTHRHHDHTSGLVGLCEARGGAALPVIAPEGQRDPELRSGSVRDGQARLEAAGCVEEVPLGAGSLAAVEGFAGVWVVRAAGHTAGSAMVIAHVRGADGVARRIAFVGDVVNAAEALEHEPPLAKPWLYRVLLGEDEGRLVEVRGWLARLRAAGAYVVPSHDLLALEELEGEGVLSRWGG